jgi:hypothetical protein
MTRLTRPRAKATPVAVAGDSALVTEALLGALQRVRNGDFDAQLPTTWTGMDGKIADTFNDIVAANRRMAEELKRVGTVVGREGRTRERVRYEHTKGAWGEMETSVNTLIDDLLRPTTEVTGAISAVAEGHLDQTLGSTSTAVPCRASSSVRDDREYDDPAALRIHLGGDACRPRGRQRRQARRPGHGAGRERRLARPH